MNGAQALLQTLAQCGVSACFANPGTSEMHLVAALDHTPAIRPVLCLFEGVATGAADGFARIAGRPAATLLHLGPGLLNGGANLHNARRAYSPSIQIVGDHATSHARFDAPLASDIAAVARTQCQWVGEARTAAACGPMAAQAYAAAMAAPGGAAALLVPADAAWSAGGAAAPPMPIPPRPIPEAEAVAAAAATLKAAKRPAVLIGANALGEAGLAAAARIAAAGVRVLTDVFPARLNRGAGRFAPGRMAYFAEAARTDLQDVDLLALVGAHAPVSFFAYPDKPDTPLPPQTAVLPLGGPEIDAAATLAALADAMGAPAQGPVQAADSPAAPTGPLSLSGVGASLTRHLPEHAIVSDDGVTGGLPAFALTAGARPHEWLCLTGGAIGQGMPVAIGAAVAAPQRKVICLTGDGAGLYTPQALWTMAREGLDVTVVVFANRSYRILNVELTRTGAGAPGPAARRLLDLDEPAVDWVRLAEAQGVPARQCLTAEDFDASLAAFLAEPGPKLIEAVV